MPAAAFFDLDKTVIATSSTLAFGKPFYRDGLVNRRAVLKSSFAQFVYLLLGADADSMDRMRDYLKALCAGWPVEQVNAIVAGTLHELIASMVYAEAVQLFDEHHDAGRDVVIVSSSGEEVVGPIGEMLGVDHVIATRMVVADGRTPVTSRSTRTARARHGGPRAGPPARLRPGAVLGLQRLVDRPSPARGRRQSGAVNPDKALRRHAAEVGWRLREFRRPGRMRGRLPKVRSPPGPPPRLRRGSRRRRGRRADVVGRPPTNRVIVVTRSP